MVGYSKSTGISLVDGLSTRPWVLGRHSFYLPQVSGVESNRLMIYVLIFSLFFCLLICSYLLCGQMSDPGGFALSLVNNEGTQGGRRR